MSLWRKKAVEMMPSFAKQINDPAVDNPMMMWIEFHCAYARATQTTPKPDEAIEQVWKYIRWCRDEYHNDEMWNAIACAFIEHLPQDKSVKEDLPNRISLKELQDFSEIFTYFNDAEVIAKYREWFAEKKKQIEKERKREKKKPVKRA